MLGAKLASKKFKNSRNDSIILSDNPAQETSRDPELNEGSKREHTRYVGFSNEAYDVFDRALTLPLEEALCDYKVRPHRTGDA